MRISLSGVLLMLGMLFGCYPKGDPSKPIPSRLLPAPRHAQRLVNVVVWAQVAERQRRVFLESQLLAVEGRMESAEGSQHLIATRLEDLSSLLGGVATVSRDFR
jgi:hypothetical protein